MTNSLADAGFLHGGGEMGERIRTFDWQGTPVGPVPHWPQSLRTSISIILDSKYPMYVAWGPDYTQFYNDAYRPILGATKHPGALGRSTRYTFDESWEEYIRPLFDRVLYEGEATYIEDWRLPLNRYGYLEECFFTFCYSAIRQETGQVGGVLVNVIETTKRVIGERRLNLLSALSARLVSTQTEDAVSAAAAVVLAEHAAEVPLALIYLDDGSGSDVRLAGSTGVQPGSAAAPRRIALDDVGDGTWPVAEVAARRRPVLVEKVDTREWSDGIRAANGGAPTQALVLPIARAGADETAGVLIAGVNPGRQLDDDYRDFLALVAGQIATGIANARAWEEDRKRAEALAALDRAKTEFYSNVSHEFRTPLTLLLGPLEEMLASPSANAEIAVSHEELDRVHRNALRLLKLVNALLDFSRIEAGRARAVLEPVDIGRMTRDLVSAFRSATERAGLALHTELDSLAGPVAVDRDMWEKVVLNLMSNAFKHTFDGSITVRLRQELDWVVLAVTDTGIGIPQDHLTHIFDRFHRVPNRRSRTHEGSGIGLALVRELVRLHDGTVGATSEVDVGTTITVRIPARAEVLSTDEGTPAGDSATSVGPAGYIAEALYWLSGEDADSGASEELGSGSGERILLVDDNADLRAYVGRLLREAGWEVDVAADGASALERVRERVPDLILSDVMMPEMDGFELLRQIRSDPETATVPVILLSARAGEDARISGLQSGADDYLIKPFAARELRARVASHLSLAKARAEARAARVAADQKLALLFQQAPVAICVLEGPEHVFRMANPLYLKIIEGREYYGRPVRDVIPEAAEHGFIELLDNVYRTGEPSVGVALPLVYDRDGRGTVVEAFFNFVYEPLQEADGSTSGIIVVATEVTGEVNARREAQAANQAKSDFLARMSHELRTPLNAIGGHAQLIELGVHGPVTDAQRQAIDRIGLNQRHLLVLINDILNVARIEAGKVDFVFEDVCLVDVASIVVAMVEPQFDRAHIRLEAPVRDATVTVRADADKLQQVLINLLSNAAKYTDAGGLVVVDVVEPPATPDRVVLRVADTGIGIPADRLDAIFDPFVQVKGEHGRAREGTGLGLAISRDLVRGMAGELYVESTEGEGSTFFVSLQRGGSAAG